MESILFIIAYVIVGFIGLDMAGHVAARNMAELRAKRSIVLNENDEGEVKKISNEIINNAPKLKNVYGSRGVAAAQVFLGVVLWPIFVPVSLYNWNHHAEEMARFMGIDI